MAYYISRFQADAVLRAASEGRGSLEVSLDLGRSKSRVALEGVFAKLPDGQRISLDILRKAGRDDTCSMVEGGEVFRMQFFLNETGRTYRLIASGPDTAPTVELSGFRMHRVKGTDPLRDAASKVHAIRPLRGRVLDTCTGLGYTAVEALSAGADEVHSVEVDEGMVRLRELNPWSGGLFDGRIRLLRGDVEEVISGFEDGFFDSIIHDPPSLSIAGGLYSLGFYSQLHRVLAAGGRMFHYVGSPGSRYRGRDIIPGVMKRLSKAGFEGVEPRPDALGLIARK